MFLSNIGLTVKCLRSPHYFPSCTKYFLSHQKIFNTAQVIAFQISAANIKQLFVTNEAHDLSHPTNTLVDFRYHGDAIMIN